MCQCLLNIQGLRTAPLRWKGLKKMHCVNRCGKTSRDAHWYRHWKKSPNIGLTLVRISYFPFLEKNAVNGRVSRNICKAWKQPILKKSAFEILFRPRSSLFQVHSLLIKKERQIKPHAYKSKIHWDGNKEQDLGRLTNPIAFSFMVIMGRFVERDSERNYNKKTCINLF